MLLALKSEHVMAAEWDKTVLQELDITATELSTDCLIDLLIRLPSLRYLCAGQQDGFTDQVQFHFTLIISDFLKFTLVCLIKIESNC